MTEICLGPSSDIMVSREQKVGARWLFHIKANSDIPRPPKYNIKPGDVVFREDQNPQHHYWVKDVAEPEPGTEFPRALSVELIKSVTVNLVMKFSNLPQMDELEAKVANMLGNFGYGNCVDWKLESHFEVGE